MELFRLLGRIVIDNSEANKALTTTTDNAKDTAKEIEDMASSGEKSGGKLGTAFSKVGDGLVKFGKVVATGMMAAGVAVGGLVTKGIQAYADYEQLVGGVETLFKESADVVQEYAKNAYKTAGLSANEYMETVTSFSASLLQSLDGDTAKAAQYADKAITDMSDNANKMGTSMEMIQNAYQGFAKQNYTMLDNLKLGYGGTKEEMQRLLEDAEKLSGKKFDISSYADVVEAIHVIQDEMGITGTTAEEAAKTISGSISAMKSSWENLLVAMTSDDLPFDEYVQAFVDSTKNVVNNMLPRIQTALTGVVTLINELAPVIIGALPELFAALLPALVTAATGLITAFVNQFPALVGVLMNVLPALIDGVVQIVNGIVAALPQIIEVLVSALPVLIPQLVAGIVSMVVTLCDYLPDIILPIIEQLPAIIESINMALMENLPALIGGAIMLVAGIVAALPKILKALATAFPAQIKGIWEGAKKAFSDVGSFFTGKFGEAKDAVVKKCGEIRDNAVTKFNELKDKSAEKINNLKDKASTIFTAMKTNASTAFNGMKTSISDAVSGAYTNVSSKFEAIKTKISNIIDTAKTTVKNGVQAIKDAFNFSWSIPKPKMPKFKVSGGKAPWGIGGKGSMPKLSIEWFKKAMNNPMVMNEPTIFGYNQSTGKFMAGGEAGSEVVAGTNTLMNMIQAAVADQNETNAYYLQKIVGILADYFPQVLCNMDKDLVLDTGALVGGIAPKMDRELGRIKSRKDRGR